MARRYALAMDAGEYAFVACRSMGWRAYSAIARSYSSLVAKTFLRQ
jgi:hypothetical protein